MRTTLYVGRDQYPASKFQLNCSALVWLVVPVNLRMEAGRVTSPPASSPAHIPKLP